MFEQAEATKEVLDAAKVAAAKKAAEATTKASRPAAKPAATPPSTADHDDNGAEEAGGEAQTHGGADHGRRSTQPVQLGTRDMAIEVKEIVRRYRYNGVTLPDVAGMSPKEIRDLYSAQYPELVSAEIETGEIVDGVQEITFKRAVGTKG